MWPFKMSHSDTFCHLNSSSFLYHSKEHKLLFAQELSKLVHRSCYYNNLKSQPKCQTASHSEKSAVFIIQSLATTRCMFKHLLMTFFFKLCIRSMSDAKKTGWLVKNPKTMKWHLPSKTSHSKKVAISIRLILKGRVINILLPLHSFSS